MHFCQKWITAWEKCNAVLWKCNAVSVKRPIIFNDWCTTPCAPLWPAAVVCKHYRGQTRDKLGESESLWQDVSSVENRMVNPVLKRRPVFGCWHLYGIHAILWQVLGGLQRRPVYWCHMGWAMCAFLELARQTARVAALPCSRRLPDIHWSRTNSCLGNMSPGKCAAGNPRTKPLHANHWLASKKQPASERDDLHPLKFDQAWRHNWSRRYHFSKPYNSGMLKFGSIYFTPNSVFPNYSYDFPLMWGCEQFQNEGRRLGIVGSHGGVLGGLGSNTDGGQGGFLGGIVAGFFKRFFFRDRLWWRMVKRLPQASASEEYKGPFQLDFGGCFSLVSRKKSGINSWGVNFFRADS